MFLRICRWRTITAWLVVAGASSILAGAQAPATFSAQRIVEGFPLLKLARVQKELNMTRGQILRIIARDQAAESLIETAIPPPKPVDVPDLTKKQEQIREQAIAEILDDRQRYRLQQLVAQQLEGSLLLRKDIEQALIITQSQQFALYMIHQETIKKVKEMPAAKPGIAGAREHHAKLRKLRLAEFNHMLRALTPTQRSRFRTILGPPLNLD